MENIKNKPNLSDIQEYKDFLFNSIDKKTSELIGQGFAFDSNQFSLSLAAQSNWTNIKSNKAVFSASALFPIQISTKNNNTYFLQEADVDNFFLSGLGAVKSAYTSGSDLKKLVFDATTIAELDLIQDAR